MTTGGVINKPEKTVSSADSGFETSSAVSGSSSSQSAKVRHLLGECAVLVKNEYLYELHYEFMICCCKLFNCSRLADRLIAT